jgi:hypothetical protein
MSLKTKLHIALTFVALISSTSSAGAQGMPVRYGATSPFQLVMPSGFSAAFQSVSYSKLLTCSGRPCVSFALASGSGPLPAWASFSSTGISGNPTASGTTSFSIVGIDANGVHTSPIATSITVAAITSVAVSPDGQIISASQSLPMHATCNWSAGPPLDCTQLAVWSFTGTCAGCSIAANGVFTAGASAATPSVTATMNGVASPGATVTVTTASVVVSTNSLPDGLINQPYAQQTIGCSGGTRPHTVALTSGSLPSGFPALPTSGAVTGTSTTAGTYSFNVTCTDSGGSPITSAPKSLSIVVAPLASIALTPVGPSIQQNAQQQFMATGSYTGETATANISAQSGGSAPALAASACGSASNNTSNVSSLSTTSACSVNVGDTLVVHYHVDHGASNPTFAIPTDAGGSTASEASMQLCQGGASDRCDQDFYIPITHANAADAVTCGFGTSTHPASCTVVKVIGAAPSPFDQAATSSDGGVAGTQGTSGSINPTVANSIAIVSLSPNAGGRAFTASTHCSAIITDAIGFTGIEACTGLTTSSTTEQMSFDGAAQGWNMAISNYKPAATSGSIIWTATDSSGINVASITSTRLATGQNGGSSNVKACIGAVCSANDLLTVSGSTTDTGLNIIPPTPPGATGTVGGTTTFRAFGNVTGNEFTNSVTWGSSDASRATIGPTSNIANDIASGTTTITATTSSGLTGSTALAISVASSSSLLAGKTPANLASPPAGWSVALTQDFENGIGPNEELAFSLISTAQSHSGSHAMQETITANAGGNQSPGGWWTFHTANVSCCTSGEIYMSWYSYLDPNAHADTESIFGDMQTNDRRTQALLMDTQKCCATPATQMSLWLSPQSGASNATECPPTPGGVADSPNPSNCGFYGPVWSLNLGTWEQEELWIHESTCTSGVPNNDGFVKFYINGQLVETVDKNNSHDRANPQGGDINGCVDMSNHPDLDLGGVFTYFGPNPSTFNKYIDDIIILKR